MPSPFKKPKTPQYTRPEPVRSSGGGAFAALGSAMSGLGRFSVLFARETGWRLWLWRTSLAPAVAALVTWKALWLFATPAPHILRLLLAVTGVVLVIVPLARRWWSKDGLVAAKRARGFERQLRRIRGEWEDICVESGLMNRSGGYPGIKAAKVTPAGVLLSLQLPRGLEIADLRSRTGELASSFQCERITVAPTTRRNVALVDVLVVINDPLNETLPTWPTLTQARAVLPNPAEDAAAGPVSPVVLPVEGRRKASDPVALGVDEHARPVTVSMVEQNLLIGGLPGSGKSAAIQLLVSSYALCDPAKVRLYIFDPKMVELKRWEHRAVEFVGKDEWDKARTVLRRIIAEMDAAYARMAADSTVRKFRPDVDVFTILAFDEIASYTADAPQDIKALVNQALSNIVRMGRAAGFAVIAATQRPTKDVLSGAAKNLFSLRVALRVGSSGDSQVILGDAAGRVANAAEIDPETPGVCFFKSETGVEAIRLRTYNLADEELNELVTLAGAAAPETAPVVVAEETAAAAGASGPVESVKTRALANVAALEGETLRLDAAKVIFTEKMLGQFRAIHPEVATVAEASLLVSAALSTHHGQEVPASRPGRRQWGYWVNTPTFAVMLNAGHKVVGIYPPLAAAGS